MRAISLVELPPQLLGASALSRKHAILQAIKAAAMNRRYELSGHEAKQDAWRYVVLSDPRSEL